MVHGTGALKFSTWVDYIYINYHWYLQVLRLLLSYIIKEEGVMQTSRPADVQPREFAKMSRLDIASLTKHSSFLLKYNNNNNNNK